MGKNLLVFGLVLSLLWSLWNRFNPPGDGPEIPKELVGDPLADVLGKMRDDLSGVAAGFCLLDEEGKFVSGWNAAIPMIPASSFKTLTTTAALDLLGPEFRFETMVKSAEAVDGVIPGDLVIQGGGDPTLAMDDLEAWAEKLKEDGILRVEGALVGDGSMFPATMAGDFWGWGDVGNGYGSPTSGLNLEHNRYVAAFRPGGKLGQRASFVGSRPEVPGVDWLNEVTTGAADSGDGVMIYGGPMATRIHLTGTVPSGGDFGVRGAVPDPSLFAAFHLDRVLKEKGVATGKDPRASNPDEKFEGLSIRIEHKSATLAEILPGLHGRSDNHETECLFQMLGVKAGRSAEEALTDYWRERKVEALRVVDGSGLSRADFISAEALARVQWTAADQEYSRVYRESLSSSHGGKARWKVGGMSSIRSWAGYVEAKDGEVLSFALMFNHYLDSSRLNHWRDELLDAVIERELGEEEEAR